MFELGDTERMKVEIRDDRIQKVLGTFPIKLESPEHRPHYDEVFGAAWRWAVAEGLVDEHKEDDYDLYLIYESVMEPLINGPLNPVFGQKILDAHKHCYDNEKEIMSSEVCGCISCLRIMKPAEVDFFEFRDKNNTNPRTACCPDCSIDTVIGSSSGYPIERAFLKAMNDFWCGGRAE